MAVDVFTNNASGTLAVDLAYGATVVTLGEGGGRNNFKYLSAGQFQRATISNSAVEGVVEVVYITSRDYETLTIVRGQEGTYDQEWPAGSTIEARITAGMLGQFLVRGDDGAVTTQNGLLINGKADSGTSDVLQLGGLQMLHRTGAKLTATYNGGYRQDLNLSVESVGGSPFIDLGNDFTPHAVDTDYAPGSIVATEANLNGNLQNAVYQSLDGSTTTSSEALSSNPVAYPLPAQNASGATVGQWLPLSNPLEFDLHFPVGLVLSEVGFICYAHTATTTPTISFGLEAQGDLVPATALSSITGANQVHRFPVSPAGALATKLMVKLHTAATGKFYGRVYWRGFFLAP